MRIAIEGCVSTTLLALEWLSDRYRRGMVHFTPSMLPLRNHVRSTIGTVSNSSL